MNPSYAIVLPVHNGMANGYLPACVATILAQAYTDFELVVLENASTDGSAEWLEQQTDSRIRYYPDPTQMPFADNWSRACETVSSEWVAFIGQDDLLEPNFLEEIDCAIQSDSEIDLVNNRFRRIDAQGSTISIQPERPSIETGIEYTRKWFREDRECYCGTMQRTAQFIRLGGFPRFDGGMASDFAITLALAHSSRKVSNLAAEIFLVRMHPASASKVFPAVGMGHMLWQFYSFLAEYAEKEPGFAAIMAEAATGDSCLRRAQAHYHHILNSENRANRPVAATVVKEIIAALELVSPGAALTLSQPPHIQRQEKINKNRLARLAYWSRSAIKA